MKLFFRFRDRFQFPDEIRISLPRKKKKPVPSHMARFAFMRLRFLAAIDSRPPFCNGTLLSSQYSSGATYAEHMANCH